MAKGLLRGENGSIFIICNSSEGIKVSNRICECGA